jgi:hypothetical protein
MGWIISTPRIKIVRTIHSYHRRKIKRLKGCPSGVQSRSCHYWHSGAIAQEVWRHQHMFYFRQFYGLVKLFLWCSWRKTRNGWGRKDNSNKLTTQLISLAGVILSEQSRCWALAWTDCMSDYVKVEYKFSDKESLHRYEPSSSLL